MINFNPMAPGLGEVEKGTPEWHMATCFKLQVLWQEKARRNVVNITEKVTDIFENESWRYVPPPNGTDVQQFCEDLIGEPWDVLIGIVKGLDQALAHKMEMKLLAPKPAREKAGRPEGKNGTNGTILSASDRDTAHARRLRRDRPELWEQVEAGTVSLNAAAIEAGFRHRTWTAPVEIERLADALLRRYAPPELEDLAKRIG